MAKRLLCRFQSVIYLDPEISTVAGSVVHMGFLLVGRFGWSRWRLGDGLARRSQ